MCGVIEHHGPEPASQWVKFFPLNNFVNYENYIKVIPLMPFSVIFHSLYMAKFSDLPKICLIGLGHIFIHISDQGHSKLTALNAKGLCMFSDNLSIVNELFLWQASINKVHTETDF